MGIWNLICARFIYLQIVHEIFIVSEQLQNVSTVCQFEVILCMTGKLKKKKKKGRRSLDM